MEPLWDQNSHIAHQVKYESDAPLSGFSYCAENGLNFSTNNANYSEDDADFAPGRRNKPSRQDPLSHRIIEKRRRDRMNSCLADLSRLIPPQFQRKGRIEKTEIIEMSIRYMKQLQNQECLHKENVYKMGYDECLQQAASFLYNSHRDICFQLMDYLKEHSNDFLKADFCKTRNNIDSISASSGSPPTNAFHAATPMNQLRTMLLTEDMEHSNSNDHNDVKDLSFRNQPQQAPVITSTAPPIVHLDSSNHDFDSSRASSVHADTELSNEKTDSTLLSQMPVRVRKVSESSHPDHEHNHNYKFKNYIQQRFLQDTNVGGERRHVETGVIDLMHEPAASGDKHLPGDESQPSNAKKAKFYDFTECSSCDETNQKPTTNGITDFKSEPAAYQLFQKPNVTPASAAAAATAAPARFASHHHQSVPIFALHSHGRHYVPLNVDYDTLVPYLGGFDLLDKNFIQMTPCHSININVNFLPPIRNKLNNPLCNGRSKSDNIIYNGW